MRGLRSAVGLILGAGIGMVVGTLVTDVWIWWLLAGAALGLVIGAVMDAKPGKGAPTD